MQIECINKFVKELTNIKKEFFNNELKDNRDKIILIKEYLSSSPKGIKKNEFNILDILQNNFAYAAVNLQIISSYHEGAVESITQPFIYKITKEKNLEIKFYFFIIFSYILASVLFFFLRRNLKNIFR